MGNVFSCFVPKTERLKNPKHKWGTHKKSQLKNLLENNDVKLQQELLDVNLEVTTGERFAEEARAKSKKTGEEDIVVEDICCFDVTWATDYVKTNGDDVTPTGAMAPSDLYIEDLDLYDSENEALGPDPTKRIFHDKTEDWGHFLTELEREYTEQLEDDLGEDFTDTDTAAVEEFADENAELGKELLNLVLARVDDIAACRERARRAEQAFKAFKQRAWRAEHTPDELSDSEDSEDDDDDRFTPPPVEGDIYTGHGILKKFNNRNENHRRGITWAAGVKPPASDKKVLGIGAYILRLYLISDYSAHHCYRFILRM